MNEERRRLRVLVALADEGTFTDAAISLGISQAAVSRTVTSLERDLGVRLVQRTTRSVAFTPAGTAVLEQARRVLDTLDAIERIARGTGSELRVGYAWSALGQHTQRVAEVWAERYPGVELVLLQANTHTAGLLEGTADIAVLRRPVDDRRLHSTVVGVEPRYAGLATSNPLARKRSLRLDDFDGCTIAIDSVTGSTTEALWPAGSGPTSTRHVRGIEEWLTVVASGRALGMTSAATAWQHPRPGVVFRPVRDVPPVPVTLAWRASDAPPSAQAFANLVAGVYAE